ncbi:MAG: 50S ribosomal protein L4 [Candidatus Pacebacteria bacterium]|nr:50S ribosomal protein L4 [Candidatus Paceibacterota bacterium]MDR3583603.1 50S ribosomal protein L4 [Candidatus Paceibacterota bacterium]
MKLKVYDKEGKELEEMIVSDAVFGLPANDALVHQVFVSILANNRQVLAHTKTRGERAGSGIKPWRQKGTGRARVGSVRTPVWRKGGVVFGPRNDRNFDKKVNKKMNSKAIATVLSGKVKDNELIVVDKLELAEKKTKEMAKIFNNLKVKGKTLVAFSGEEKDLRLVSRNIIKTENILTDQLNVADMLNNKNLVMSKESVKFLEKKYSSN